MHVHIVLYIWRRGFPVAWLIVVLAGNVCSCDVQFTEADLYAAAACCYCVARGVVHRDIKPGNVLLCSLNEGAPGELTTDNVKVTDFGISVPYTPGRVSIRRCSCKGITE
jgi:serine/threonine protein kinase